MSNRQKDSLQTTKPKPSWAPLETILSQALEEREFERRLNQMRQEFEELRKQDKQEFEELRKQDKKERDDKLRQLKESLDELLSNEEKKVSSKPKKTKEVKEQALDLAPAEELSEKEQVKVEDNSIKHLEEHIIRLEAENKSLKEQLQALLQLWMSFIQEKASFIGHHLSSFFKPHKKDPSSENAVPHHSNKR